MKLNLRSLAQNNYYPVQKHPLSQRLRNKSGWKKQLQELALG